MTDKPNFLGRFLCKAYPGCHGRHGSAAIHGSSPPLLDRADIEALPDGALVVVTWSGGNGPHLCRIVAEGSDERARYGEKPTGWTRSDILDEASYVSLPGTDKDKTP